MHFTYLKYYFTVLLCLKYVQSTSTMLTDFFDTETDNSEEKCLDLLNHIEFDNSHLKSAHIGYAMKKGLWKCAKDMAALLQGNGVDIRNEIELETRMIMKEIASIKTAMENLLPSNIITPAFQWAQSPNEIFLNVKFAHKLDAPATLNVEVENVTLSENKLLLTATDGRKIFKFQIEM